MKNFLIAYKKKITLVLLFIMLVNFVALSLFDTALKNEICENGIVSFELAKNVNNSTSILNSWDTNAKINAGLSLGFDFLFLLVYAGFIAMLIFNINERLWKNKAFYKFGNSLISLIFTAALFDIIENISLIKLLTGDIKQIWSSIAYYAAVIKFTIILICIAYLLINWMILLLKKDKI